ncbi:MAG: FHA domain-containing protein [Lentisphaeraceae bacterium]|nr:FHA domain-containing protein [Lentisphaeraceae bacterium]
MPAFLEIIYKDKSKEVIPCSHIMTFGRDQNSTICLKDPMISRNHGVIRSVGHEKYYVLDTGSRNGVQLNSRRISSPILLKNGDLIKAGDTTITFTQDVVSLDESSDIYSDDFAETMQYVKPDIRSVVVLVSDIRGFTTMSELLPIETLTALMSYWFIEVQNLVEKHSGIVDKFIGDCVLAKWEVDAEDQKSLLQALRTSVELNNFTKGLYQKYPEIGHELQIGVGLNQGIAAVGIGADNTIMGDVVNTAFRLETASKDLKSDLVLNSSFYERLPKAQTVIKETTISVKGKAEKLRVSAVNFETVENYLQELENT